MLTGYIKNISEIITYTSGFKKRTIVIKTDEKYPQTLLFEILGDKTSIVDDFMEGQKVNVFFNLRGREWVSQTGEVRYFNSFVIYRLENADQNNEQTEEKKPIEQPTNSFVDNYDSNEEHDDLPF